MARKQRDYPVGHMRLHLPEASVMVAPRFKVFDGRCRMLCHRPLPALGRGKGLNHRLLRQTGKTGKTVKTGKTGQTGQAYRNGAGADWACIGAHGEPATGDLASP